MSERWTIRYMEIVLIRHGATAGNIEKRYIGITDENLCDTGIVRIQEYMSDRMLHRGTGIICKSIGKGR